MLEVWTTGMESWVVFASCMKFDWLEMIAHDWFPKGSF